MEFLDIKLRSESLRTRFEGRNELAEKIENIFLMRDNIDAPPNDAIVVTRSPDNRQSVVTARRLLSTSRPQINIPYDRKDEQMRTQSEDIEKYATALLYASDHYSRKPLHFNVSHSMLLYDECHIAINLTSDILEASKGQSPAYRKRAERMAKSTPILFKPLLPRTGYPEFDDFGLVAYARTSEMTLKQAIGIYGAPLENTLGDKYNISRDLERTITVWEYWDMEIMCKWVEGCDPFLNKPHNFPTIPIVVVQGEGSDLFYDEKDQREPFLLTEHLSGLGARKSLMLTALYSKLKFLGFVPPISWEHDVNTTIDLPEMRQQGLFQYLDAGSGRLVTLDMPMDPAFELGLNIAERKGEETTISKVATGQYLGSGTAFSTHALLSQLGRLPLETIRTQSGAAIAAALRTAFTLLASESPRPVRDFRNSKDLDLEWEVLDTEFELQVEMDVALPQDLQSQAGVFNTLYGKVPGRMLFERILKLGQYNDAMDELWDEQAASTEFALFMEKKQLEQKMMLELQFEQQRMQMQAQMQMQMQGMMQQAQAQQAQAQQAQQAQAMQQQQGMERQMMQQRMEQEAAMQRNPQAAMMGAATEGGLPPEMAQQGMGPMEPAAFEEEPE